MPGTITAEAPTVSLSFANNFWGKDDAGVSPLLERMHNAKVTGEELKSFYTARAQIEDDYARKLLNLARKPLGSSEAGTLRMSLDVVRGEVESMGKAHQQIAGQMKSELDEPLSAFTGGMKERRKIIQNGIEKLLKTKNQQSALVNKARDRYEQDCLKIKGYLAQGHMVMGQEERKNKAKLEKTQIQLSNTSNEYEQAVKILEETTGRWNKEWKAGCDKFQDLEEERLDFMKSSLWSFANISSTVCVSDDASCEKVRLSLEDCDVEKDITGFIKEQGTGQEIPDPPRFINFCRGDINDNASEASDDGAYSVAQFQRTMNPAFRSSSPQPSTYESHHDPDSMLAQEMGMPPRQTSEEPVSGRNNLRSSQNSGPPVQSTYDDIPKVPHNEYPMDGMTQFCRIGPPSERSSIPSPTRPDSCEATSEYSNPTSYSSFEPSSRNQSPEKQFNESTISSSSDDRGLQKKRSGFFKNSPFRRQSKHERDQSQSASVTPSARNTWAPAGRNGPVNSSPTRPSGRESRNVGFGNNDPTDADPADPRANFQLNVGNNVFDVASPDNRRKPPPQKQSSDEVDPIAQALAELKGVAKQASVRVSADRWHGIATPAPASTPTPSDRTPGGTIPRPFAGQELRSTQSGTPPPSYDQQPVSRLGAPQPAFTSKQMQQTTASYVGQKRDVFSQPRQGSYDQRSQSRTGSRPGTREGRPSDIPRATSPAPLRSASPRPYTDNRSQQQYRAASPNPYGPGGAPGRPRAASPNPYGPGPNGAHGNPRSASPNPYGPGPNGMQGHPRSASPNPYGPGSNGMQGHPRSASPNPYGPGPNGGAGRPRAQTNSPIKPQGFGSQPGYGGGPGNMPRSRSPQPGYGSSANRGGSRPPSSRGSENGAMAIQLAQGGDPRGRGSFNGNARPTSQMYGDAGPYGAVPAGPGGQSRTRSQSSAGQRQVNKEGRPILHFARALYMYQAAIPEELSFAKGDMLAVLRHQDDGWWEAENPKGGRAGLVPSNYLQSC